MKPITQVSSPFAFLSLPVLILVLLMGRVLDVQRNTKRYRRNTTTVLGGWVFVVDVTKGSLQKQNHLGYIPNGESELCIRIKSEWLRIWNPGRGRGKGKRAMYQNQEWVVKKWNPIPYVFFLSFYLVYVLSFFLSFFLSWIPKRTHRPSMGCKHPKTLLI